MERVLSGESDCLVMIEWQMEASHNFVIRRRRCSVMSCFSPISFCLLPLLLTLTFLASICISTLAPIFFLLSHLISTECSLVFLTALYKPLDA